MTLFDELLAVLKCLDEAQVEYALIGGLAVAIWGAPRATKDIDLIVRREGLNPAKTALRACDFVMVGSPLEFKDGSEVHRVNRVDAAGDVMTVDFMVVDANLESAWRDRTKLPFGQRDVAVVSRESLIAMKARAARPQDIADIQNLKDFDR